MFELSSSWIQFFQRASLSSVRTLVLFASIVGLLLMPIAVMAANAKTQTDGAHSNGYLNCSISRLQSCDNTNQLVLSKRFNRTVNNFLGSSAKRTVRYLYVGTLQSELTDVLGGPPDDRRKIVGGGYLFTACRYHSCFEKGAIAFDENSNIVAMAIISFPCGETAGASCTDNPTLDLFIQDAKRSSAAHKAIAAWAKRAVSIDELHLQGEPIVHYVGSANGKFGTQAPH